MIKNWVFAAATFTALYLPWTTALVEAEVDKLPRLPGATLLTGYVPDRLFITIGNETKRLQGDALGDVPISPSISADGSIVASAHRISGDPFTRAPRLMVSTYSLADDRWIDHKELEVMGGSVAISPDGSKLACVARKMPNVTSSGLRILDLESRKVTLGPEMSKRGSGISWSPDGRRIAFEKDDNPPISILRTIYVLDIETARVSKVASGMAPSWSPSGEWIAFVDMNQAHSEKTYRVGVMHPDGTGAKVLTTFHSDVVPDLKPVWSPDSKRLLINESQNADKDIWDIYLLDLATLRLTKKFRNVPPVFGWVTTK